MWEEKHNKFSMWQLHIFSRIHWVSRNHFLFVQVQKYFLARKLRILFSIWFGFFLTSTIKYWKSLYWQITSNDQKQCILTYISLSASFFKFFNWKFHHSQKRHYCWKLLYIKLIMDNLFPFLTTAYFCLSNYHLMSLKVSNWMTEILQFIILTRQKHHSFRWISSWEIV